MRVLLATLHSKFIHASLALPCLAAYGREAASAEILIREFTVHELKEQIVAALLEERPDVVAFSVYIWNRHPTLEVVDALAVAAPQVEILVGGPEVSFDGPQLFERHPGLTGLMRGEGEAPFREFLQRRAQGIAASGIPRTLWRRSAEGLVEGSWSPPLADLDAIPSPFSGGLVDLERGFVYLETSRGCPYGCSFCMSSLDREVRSFSPARIRSDLRFLMSHRIPKIKLVDRTFNYDPARAREIFAFILANNRSSHFHFEIGANLLDDATLELLERVPEGMFQFEIGIQSTSPQTLAAIHRPVFPDRVRASLDRLRRHTRISLHLDLIAGLPCEGYDRFLASLDQVLAYAPHHLQIEPVKLLPGSPLRGEAQDRGLRFDPNPPYTVLSTPDLSFAELEKLRGLGRLLDLLYNSVHCRGFAEGLATCCGSYSRALEALGAFWSRRRLFRFPLQQRDLFERLQEFIDEEFTGEEGLVLQELLARDLAHCERPVGEKLPAFFDTGLSDREKEEVQERVRLETARVRGKGVKLQYFAAIFSRLPEFRPRTLVLFIYRTRTGAGRTVEEIRLGGDP
jgi:anaerobic magnesium-protoporphyrin IX monomethyl ester cyclase